MLESIQTNILSYAVQMGRGGSTIDSKVLLTTPNRSNKKNVNVYPLPLESQFNNL